MHMPARPSRPRSPRTVVAVGVAGVAALATITVGLYGLLTGPGSDARTSAGSSVLTGRTPGTRSIGGGPVPVMPVRRLPATDDPIVYAKAVATALFDWDTSSGLLPTDYTSPVLADADPSGVEMAGLIGDVTTFEPTTDEWAQLATMSVAQHLIVSTVKVPFTWAQALAQARGQLRPGTTALTVTGTRVRTGVWDGEPAKTSDPVSFTIFFACAPAYPHCHTLRLSQLDNPLP